MFNFNVDTVDLGAYYRGLNQYNAGQAQQQALNMRQNQMQQQQQQAQQIQSLSQAALSGDPKALQQLAAIDPARAAQVQQFQQSQTPQFDAGAIKTGITQAVEFARSGQNDLAMQALTATASQAPQAAQGDFQRMMSGLQSDPQRFVQSMDSLINPPTKQQSYKPEISTPQVDENGQQYVIVTDPNTQTTRRVDVVGGKVETGDDKMNREIRKGLLEDAAKVSRESFDQLKTVRSQIGNFDTAIKALDQGAQSGPFQQMLPSIQQSTIELENAAQRLGLDVISATTFGALSEGELRLAMNTAVPLNLEPKALKKWLQDKKKAQQKLGSELYKMATTLGKGKTTIAEYLEKNNYSAAPQQATQPAQPDPSKPLFSPALNSEVTEQQIQDIMSRGYTREEVMQKLGVN